MFARSRVGLKLQILPEERALKARFPEAYVQYCRRVPRWL